MDPGYATEKFDNFSLPAVIMLGWEQMVYAASENNQAVELCASVTGVTELQIAPFQLDVQYFDISASEFD